MKLKPCISNDNYHKNEKVAMGVAQVVRAVHLSSMRPWIQSPMLPPKKKKKVDSE
jgi:hypothetical protein